MGPKICDIGPVVVAVVSALGIELNPDGLGR
jgi:hypothetical protein